MCGLAGFIDLKGLYDKQKQAVIGTAMADALAHRGPDDSGLWQDEESGVTLTFRRLSIIDLSREGHQPMKSASGRYVITYNGEIYNFPDLRAQLEDKGHTFKGRSDTEVMLSAFDEWGINQSLQKLNGMFAIALWDRQEKTLHLMRDRFGQKPLYIGWAGSSLVFASELKAFHQHPDFQKTIDRSALTNYMQYGYIHAPSCIFKNVWQLLPATRLRINLDDITPHQNLSDDFEPYWYLPRVTADARDQMHKGSDQDIADEFEGLIKKSIKQRMVSDVPLGAFLSGGIDSSTVTSFMQQGSSSPVKTFSIGFKETDYDEAQHAKAIASYLGTDHTEFYVSAQDAMDVIPFLPTIYDEPFADVSQIPTYLVSKLARQHVTVALSGDGGDELLGGYTRHSAVPAIWKRVSVLPRPLRSLIGKAFSRIPQNRLNAMRPNHPQFGRLMHRLAGMLEEKDARAVYTYLLSSWRNAPDLVLNGQSPNIPLNDPLWHPQGLNFAETMIYGDNLSYRPNDLMVKTDRASMAASLEARAPFMDHVLYEYCARLPHRVKVRDGKGKWLLREILGRHIPKEQWDRPKMGFNVPINDWLRGPLREWADDLLSTDMIRAQGYFDADIMSKAWQDHLNGKGAAGNHIWTALMFQSWHKEWMEK